MTIDRLCEGREGRGIRNTRDLLNLGIQDLQQVLVVMRIDLDQEAESAQGVLGFHHFGNLLQRRDDLVVHRSFLHGNTDIHAELVTQHLRLNMVTGTGNDTILEHLLHALMHRGAAHPTLLRYIAERNAGTLRNNLKDFAIQFVYFFHYFAKMIKFERKDTVFFGYMQIFLYFCRKFYSIMTLEEYISGHSSPENAVLEAITRDTHVHVLNPHMLSGHVQGRVLSMISHMIRPKRILELGTFTGYSALCLAEGLAEGGKLMTIEHNDELEDTIRRNLSRSPLADRIELRIGDAKEVLSDLTSGGHNKEGFELVFIDADKREYCAYLDLVYPLVPVGGFILADNTLWDGHIIDPAYAKDKQTLGLRAFNDQLKEDDRFEQVILPLRDGLTLIRKIK